ncbi:MAG: PAS domain-containing sensor histidine kinase [Bacteroidetes bacterium]|nr:MAG: PAS domain-containing sensor histidine kinase [Bacteroidota bacterium]
MTKSDDASRLRAIIETAIDGIITIDEQGCIDTINPAAAQMFGYEPEAVLGENVSMLMPQPHRAAHDTYVGNYLRTGEARIIGVGREVLGLRKDGSTFPFRLAISEVKLENGTRLFTGIIHDLTRQKTHEEQLRRYAADLERSNQELENFAYVSSHDLQEPLRKIQAFGSRIESRERDRLSEQGQDYLRRMLSASSRMQTLINDLLAFSRVSSRARPFERTDLNTILDEVLSDLEILIQETGAQIQRVRLPALMVDPTQFRQLFQNLIGNAIKFRREGETPLIRIEMAEAPAPAGQETLSGTCWHLQIADNGIGFDEKYLDRIFDIFQRLEGRRYEGSGIGLAICRKIVLRHGGYITARSQPGKGTTFSIYLPILTSTEPPDVSAHLHLSK